MWYWQDMRIFALQTMVSHSFYINKQFLLRILKSSEMHVKSAHCGYTRNKEKKWKKEIETEKISHRVMGRIY